MTTLVKNKKEKKRQIATRVYLCVVVDGQLDNICAYKNIFCLFFCYIYSVIFISPLILTGYNIHTVCVREPEV